MPVLLANKQSLILYIFLCIVYTSDDFISGRYTKAPTNPTTANEVEETAYQ